MRLSAKEDEYAKMTPIALHFWLLGKKRCTDSVTVAVYQSKVMVSKLIEGFLKMTMPQEEPVTVSGRTGMRLARLVKIFQEHLLTKGHLPADEDALDLPERMLDLSVSAAGCYSEIGSHVQRDVPAHRFPSFRPSHGSRMTLNQSPQFGDLVVLRLPHQCVEILKLVVERQGPRSQEIHNMREHFAVTVDEIPAVRILRDRQPTREHHLDQVVR